MTTFNMARVPPLTFGAGRIKKLPALVADLGGAPALIIADAALAGIGVTDRLTQALSTAGIAHELVADIAGEPKETLVDALAARARTMAAQTVIGIGGGAAMDTAKLVAAIARADRPARDFALAAQTFPTNRIPAIAVPTTAGTGSEVTRTAIVSTPDGIKNWFWGEELMFSQAVLDPELTVSLPPHVTAWTGIDAVAHALEGVTSRSSSPAGRLYGLEALRILSAALPAVVADGTDVARRGEVLWASLLAGLTLHNCNTHMGHNISHAVGSLAPVHHGRTTGLALEVTLPWLVTRPDGAENYALACEALGGPAKAEALPEYFAALMRGCAIVAELPEGCGALSSGALATEMKSKANIGMSQNAACPVSANDIDTMAEMMMALPRAGVAA